MSFPSEACTISKNYKHLGSIKQIEKIIKECKVRSLESLLSKLPKELRKRYTLVYKSNGIGTASPKFPRVIYSGYKNNLTFTHSTDPSSKDYGTLELMEYSRKLKDYRFKVILFDQVHHSKPRFSKINPARCLACHHNSKTKKNQAIWHDVPLWPGVYGSVIDKHWFIEEHLPPDQPGWKMPYYHSEQEAYSRFIEPKLGKTGLFKYLSPDIYSKLDKYGFRTGLRMESNLHYRNNQLQLDALKKHLRKKKIHLNKVKYYLSYANTCVKEERVSAGYSMEDLLEIMKKVLDANTLKRALIKAARKHNISSRNNLIILKSLYKKISKKFALNFADLRNETCDGLDLLYSSLGVGTKVNCPLIFNEPLGDVERAKFWNNYGVNQASHIGPHYIMIYVFLNYIDFPFENWSMDKKKFSGFGTNYNMVMGLQNVIFNSFDFKNTDPEIYKYVVKKKIVSRYYREFMDFPFFPNLPDFEDQFKTFYNKFCPEIIGPKSYRYTKGL